MKLIINADDLGLSKSVSDGIAYAYNKGIISSTSIFANLEFTSYGIEIAKSNRFEDVGLHVNLTVGTSLSKNKKLCPFKCDSLVLPKEKLEFLSKITYEDAKNEVYAQLESLQKNGAQISHIDTHGGISSFYEIFNAVSDVAYEENLPFRCYEQEYKKILVNKSVKSPDIFYMSFYNKGVNENTLNNIISENLLTDNTVEIMTHLGFVDDYTVNFTNYNFMRQTELEVLEKFLIDKNVTLISHKDL